MREIEIPGPFLGVMLDGCVAYATGAIHGPIGIPKQGTVGMLSALLQRGYLISLCTWRDIGLCFAWCEEHGFRPWLDTCKLRIHNLIPEGMPLRWICETSHLRNAYETLPNVGVGIQS